MKNMYIVVNIDLAREFTEKGDINLLWIYCTSSYIMRGLGYYDKAKFIKVFAKGTGKSIKTVYKYIKKLSDSDLLTEKNGILHIKGKNKLKKEFKITTKNCIRFYEDSLVNLNVFKKTLVTQSALLLQKRFRYSYSNIKRNSESLYNKGMIQGPYSVSYYKSGVGVSLSKVSEYLGISKSNVKLYANGSYKKMYNVVKDSCTMGELKALHQQGFFKENYMYTWKKRNVKGGGYVFSLLYKLPSVYTCNYNLCRSTY